MTETAADHRLWDEAEALPRERLEALQLERLREAVARAGGVPFYRDRFAESGVIAADVTSLEDVRKLPLTSKADLVAHYPTGLLAVPREQVARVHGSSGTTGRPTFAFYTKDDLETWADLCARFLTAGGLRKNHLAHIAFGFGLFTGGFGLHYGVERVGAGVVPAASGNTRRQIMLLMDLAPEAIVCTPSYALTIAETAKSLGLRPDELPIEVGHFGGEPWTEEMRQRIEAELGIEAFNNYGLSEVLGPGVAGECHCHSGMHLHEDHFLVECLDPQTLEPVAPGEVGELVITTLTKQAMPVLRYRTRDLACLSDEPCPCGRTGRRMGRVLGRSDDMLIIRGVNVFPSQIEEALLRVEGTEPHYQIEVSRPNTLDELSVHVEVEASFFSDQMREMDALRRRLEREVHTTAGVRAKINLVQPRTLERFAGKAKRVIDHRESGK
ncbi:MAG: phenylacetate--CoA ligase family protein [Phycisphaeraceae bacterium]